MLLSNWMNEWIFKPNSQPAAARAQADMPDGGVWIPAFAGMTQESYFDRIPMRMPWHLRTPAAHPKIKIPALNAAKKPQSARLHLARQERVFLAENRRRRMCHPQWWTERSGKRTDNRLRQRMPQAKAFPTGERPFSRRPTEGATLHRQANLSGKQDSRGRPWLWPWIPTCPRRTPCPTNLLPLCIQHRSIACM